MRLQNLENRVTAAGDLASQMRAASQASVKSFNSRLSSTFGSALSEFSAAEGSAESAARGGGQRQNLVAGASNSRSPLTSVAATPAIVSTPAGSPATTSGLQSLVDAADRTSSGATPSVTSVSPTTTPSAAITTQTTSATPKDTPSGPAAPPTLYSSTQGLSTDPAVFSTENYSEQLLYSSYLQQANNENSLRYQNYVNEYQNWQLNGSQGQAPDAPVYEAIDQNAFGQWYAQMTTNYSQGLDAPDVSSFMANGPDYGNGYYGAVGTFQVGTLYNPTGPATPDQISAAGGSPNSSVKSA